jgi:hypothetical protein
MESCSRRERKKEGGKRGNERLSCLIYLPPLSFIVLPPPAMAVPLAFSRINGCWREVSVMRGKEAMI